MRSVLPYDWDVPEVFRKRLGEGAGRQRCMTADGHLLLVLHQPPTPGVSTDVRLRSVHRGSGPHGTGRHAAAPHREEPACQSP